MSIEIRTLLRGVGGTACAASMLVALASFAGGFTSYTTVAAQGNKGDVWTDTVGSNDGPEMDPHMPCADFNVWGMKLQNSSGPFTIQGWPPSGGGASEIDYSANWTYDLTGADPQVIATVPVDTLLANARASGDTAQPQQGFHFKLDVEDPRGNSTGDDKYKVFWISCGTTTPTPTSSVSGSSSSSSTGSSPSPSPENSSSSTSSGPSPSPTSSVSGTSSSSSSSESSPSPTVSGGVSGTTTTETTVIGGVSGINTTSTTGGGVGGISTPFTGTALPLGLSGGLMALGLGMLGVARRIKRRNNS